VSAARRRGFRLLVALLAVVEAGWLAFDGVHALVTGDYVTPASGLHAGQLGPWADLVGAVGLEPRSTLVKSIHVALGTGWLVTLSLWAAGAAGARRALIVAAALGLWYVPFGTLLGVAQIALLLSPPLRDPT
jgi:hypothetical protein